MITWYPKTHDCILETTCSLPEKYSPHQIEHATVCCIQWNNGTIASQTLSYGAQWLQLLIIDLKRPVQVAITSRDHTLFLSCLLEDASIPFIMEGFGKVFLPGKHMRLCHVPTDTIHSGWLEEGHYRVLYLSAPQLGEQEVAPEPPCLQFLVSKWQQRYASPLLQSAIPIHKIAAEINSFSGKKMDEACLRQLSDKVLQEYILKLRKESRARHISQATYLLAIKAKEYIDTHAYEHQVTENLAGIFKTSATTLKRAFTQVIGQTVWGYYHEIRMLKARDMIRSQPDIQVQEVASAIDMKTDNFTKRFNDRFCITPSEYIRQVQAIKIQEALQEKEKQVFTSS